MPGFESAHSYSFLSLIAAQLPRDEAPLNEFHRHMQRGLALDPLTSPLTAMRSLGARARASIDKARPQGLAWTHL